MHSLAVQCLNNQPDVVVVVVGQPTVSTRGIVEQMVQEMSSSGVAIHNLVGYVTFDQDSRAGSEVVDINIICHQPLPWQVCSLSPFPYLFVVRDNESIPNRMLKHPHK